MMYYRQTCVRATAALLVLAVLSSIAAHYYTEYLLHLDHDLYSAMMEDAAPAAPSMLDNICSIPVRLDHIAQTCESRGWSQESWDLSQVKGNVVVDDAHQLIYCIVSKVGSISIRSLLGRLIRNEPEYKCTPDFLNDTGCRALKHMPRSEQLRVMHDYKKLMVVRHPLDKLRSAYDAKLSTPGRMNYKALKRNIKTITKYLLKQGTANFTQKYFNPEQDTISFPQFLDLVGSRYHERFQDEHWITMEERCRPCQIQYDFFLRLETLADDSQPFYDHLQQFSSGNVEIPHENRQEARDPKEKMLHIKSRYDEVDPTLVKKVTEVYERDLTLFGYDWSFNSGASCGIDYQPGRRCC